MRVVMAKAAPDISEFQRTPQLVYIRTIKADRKSVTDSPIARRRATRG